MFREDILDLIAAEGADEFEVRSYEQDALNLCLLDLSDKHRSLLNLAYTPGVKIRDLARNEGATPEAFYMRLNRLRRSLMKCVEGKIPELKRNESPA